MGALFVLIVMGVWIVVAGLVKSGAKEPASEQVDTTVVCEEQPVCGGYSDYREPMPDEVAFFESTYAGAPKLKPEAVATQVVAGTNYRFRCVDNNGERYEVTIFVPLPCNQQEQPTEVTSVVKK